ncbi:putative DNA topoisomerase 2-binding protein 1-A isoform X1 [Iris pallida]|uniref:DNA topoisomerase 2-binding protein 1-A isoform X1 n=1 Tax=Iris pallida TaxID=29817 RepID=A0AAX6FYI7_IRIPA|nr:putative DNA topoisomerase 2-binding protein 1-A isoform X1 [Iris pallida]
MAAVTRTTTFAGANVYLSRSLVPPEFFDALRDALKINGAHVFLCSDPSQNSPSDYHVISSMDHEKFEDLRSKGCNLLGPHCVLSCAKEHRVLPKQGYTCCLAMDGVKVLASGFEKDEKARIQKLVTAMGGILETRASLDVNFVIVKTVLASKYKCALNVLKKPIVNLSWLSQCWTEHRVVPHDRFRVLPFSGLTVCVTRIPAEERKEMEKLIILNGGLYSPNLTKNYTLDMPYAAVGDKYLVARRWGNIHIVTRKWIDQSIAKGGCLHEGSYPVEGVPKSCNTMEGLQKEHCHQEFSNASSQHVRSAAVDDLEATVSQSITSPVSVGNGINNEVFAPSEPMKEEASNVNPVAEIPRWNMMTFICRTAEFH